MSTLSQRLLSAVALLLACIPLHMSYQANPASMPCLLTAEIALIFSLWVVWQAPGNPLHRSFFSLCLAFFGYLFTAYLLHIAVYAGIDRMERAVRVARIGLFMGPVTILHFVMNFANIQSRWIRSLVPLALLATMPFLYLNYSGQYVTEYRLVGVTYVPSGNAFYYKLFAVFLAISFFLAAIIVTIRLFQPAWRSYRPQFSLFLFGWYSAFIYAFLGFLPVFKHDYYPSLLGIAWAFFPLCLGIAVLRYGLFSIKILIRRTLPYALGTVGIGVLYALFILAVNHLFPKILHTDHTAQAMILLVLTGFCFQPLLEGLQHLLDKALFRTELEMDRDVLECGKKFAECYSMESLFQTMVDDVKARVGAESAVLLAGRQTPEIVVGLLSKDREPLLSNIRFDSINIKNPVMELQEAHSELLALLDGKEASVVLLPFAGREIRGIIVLGEKKSHVRYSAKEVAVLSALVRQMATALARIEAEQSECFTREFTDTLLQSMNSAAAHLTKAGKILRINRSFRETFGTVARIDEIGLDMNNLGMAREAGPKEISVRGRLCVVGCQSITGTDDWVVLLTDITELNDLRERERRNAALAEIGAAVSAVNHEIQNIISPVRFFLEKARSQSSKEEIEATFAAIGQRFQLLESVTKELRGYYRPPPLYRMESNLAGIVQSALADVAIMKGDNWVQPMVGNLAIFIHIDPQQIKRVLVNILKNAWEAMESISKKQWSISLKKTPESALLLAIRDNGKGMPAELQKKVFQLFFSQKKEAGTGLGLAISRRILEAHGGTITFSSQEGIGSEFVLQFPAECLCQQDGAITDRNHANTIPFDAMN